MAEQGAITTATPNQFPTIQADLNKIAAYATAHGRPSPPFPDPNALAIEVKAAWVEATGLPTHRSGRGDQQCCRSAHAGVVQLALEDASQARPESRAQAPAHARLNV